jgi:hypothetical protein
MKIMNIVRACGALAVLGAGTLVAVQVHASECDYTEPFNYCSPNGGEASCCDRIWFCSADKGLTTARVAVSLNTGNCGDTTTEAFIYGTNDQGQYMTGCIAEDTTTDGQSVSYQGVNCTPATHVVAVVQYH